MRQPYRHLIRAIQAAGLGPHIRKVNKRLKLPHARRTSLDVGDGASVSPPPQGNEVAAFDSETDISDMVQAQIQWLAARSVECVSQEWLSTASSGQFAILGLDYMLDQQGRFSLLEVTKGAYWTLVMRVNVPTVARCWSNLLQARHFPLHRIWFQVLLCECPTII